MRRQSCNYLSQSRNIFFYKIMTNNMIDTQKSANQKIHAKVFYLVMLIN